MNAIHAAIILALALTVSACTGGETPGTSATASFIGGTSAVKLSFIENAPPAEVTDDDFEFDVIVTAENTGEQSIAAPLMTVKLTGFFPDDFSTTTPALTKTIGQTFTGVRKDPDGNKINGDLQQFTFANLKYKNELEGNQQFPIRAEACYAYKTRAISQLCLMGDLTKPEKPVCNPTGARSVANSGAPVHVTSVTQSVGGKNKAILTFTVQKVGTEDIFSLGTDKCTDSFSNKNRVKAAVIMTGLGTGTLDCLGLLREPGETDKTQGELLFDNGQATFTCIQTITDTNLPDSMKTFTVELDYFARTSATKTIIVKHLFGSED